MKRSYLKIFQKFFFYKIKEEYILFHAVQKKMVKIEYLPRKHQMKKVVSLTFHIKLEEKGRICTILFLEIHSSAYSNAEQMQFIG